MWPWKALVRDPKLFLFDEPLSNLDAKLRVEMRTEIKKLHQSLGASMVYVTHDQIEAMTLATKIVVMQSGGFNKLDHLLKYTTDLIVSVIYGFTYDEFDPAMKNSKAAPLLSPVVMMFLLFCAMKMQNHCG